MQLLRVECFLVQNAKAHIVLADAAFAPDKLSKRALCKYLHSNWDQDECKDFFHVLFYEDDKENDIQKSRVRWAGVV